MTIKIKIVFNFIINKKYFEHYIEYLHRRITIIFQVEAVGILYYL